MGNILQKILEDTRIDIQVSNFKKFEIGLPGEKGSENSKGRVTPVEFIQDKFNHSLSELAPEMAVINAVQENQLGVPASVNGDVQSCLYLS